jgi:hypothetical protein
MPCAHLSHLTDSGVHAFCDRLYPHAQVWQLGMTNPHTKPVLRESP